MAPKRCYDVGRLGDAAEEAAKRAQASHGHDVTFTCSYGGTVGGRELKKTAMVQFAWRAVAGEFNEEHTVQVRCDNACAQGVPLPEPLKAALRLRCLGQAVQGPENWQARMEEAAGEATTRAEALLGIGAEVTCTCGGAVGGGKLKKTAMVKSMWRVVIGDGSEEHTVNVRCDKACARGVPLPETLRVACGSASRRHRLDQMAKEAEGAVKFEGAVVTCRLDHAHNVLYARAYQHVV